MRLVIAGLLLTFLGCTAHRVVAETPQFPNQEQKLLACLELQDHIVDLYAAQYAQEQGLTLSAPEKTAFRDGWAEELAKQGTFDRFEQSCFYSLTEEKYRCGMAATSPGNLNACMRALPRAVSSATSSASRE